MVMKQLLVRLLVTLHLDDGFLGVSLGEFSWHLYQENISLFHKTIYQIVG